jgi:3'-phosphoadenosine 5'-phosphosulfate sulfotransferase (PAPS reductase)/FAD synthetase
MSLEAAATWVHTRHGSYLSHLKQAQGCIEYAQRLCKNPFVSFSAGKDSSVMLHLVLCHTENIRAAILTGGETRLLHSDIDDIFAWWRASFPKLELIEIFVDHVFSEGWEGVGFWEQHASFKNEWVRFLHSQVAGDGVYIGLRAAESAMRKARLRQRLPGCQYAIRQYSTTRGDVKAGVYRISPLENWTGQDISAYISLHGIPVLRAYQHGAERTKTRFGHPSLALGELGELRIRDPRSYDQFMSRFPEMRLQT